MPGYFGNEISDAPATPKPVTTAAKAADERMASFHPEPARRRFEDLVVADGVRQELESMLASIEHQQTLYVEWGLGDLDPVGPRSVLNMYGPPGTGKTFCAEAIAHRLGRSLIRANYAEMESKYVGETPKNIQAAFQRAKETGSVLFFDEADSILGRRLTNVTQSADHGVNASRAVMLQELDKFEGVVIFATNLAKNYDTAFVRRILAHVEMPLPDAGCRVKLWAMHLPERLPRTPEVTAESLAEASEGLSGGDIWNAVRLAATRAVQREGEARRLAWADLEVAIAHVRRARREVGAQGPEAEYVRETVPLSEAPPAVQARHLAMLEGAGTPV